MIIIIVHGIMGGEWLIVGACVCVVVGTSEYVLGGLRRG